MTDVGQPWFRRRGLLAAVALAVLAGGIVVGLVLAAGDDDGAETVATADSEPTDVVTTVPPTTAPAATPTTLSAEQRCAVGDQLGCDQLTDQRLDELCDEGHGNLDACQVLLARQGDGVPDGPEGERGPDRHPHGGPPGHDRPHGHDRAPKHERDHDD